MFQATRPDRHLQLSHFCRKNLSTYRSRKWTLVIVLSLFLLTTSLHAFGATFVAESGSRATRTVTVDPAYNGGTYQPAIVVGDPDGSPPVTPKDRIDPNVSTSAFAGVVSINTVVGSNSYIGSGSAISSRQILTAAHVVDTDYDGTVDASLNDSSVVFNHQDPAEIVTGVASIDVHRDWTGFNNPSINDDLAVITLSSDLPSGVPIYPYNRDPFTTVENIIMAGYGRTGNGIDGFTKNADFYVKRTGQNLASTA